MGRLIDIGANPTENDAYLLIRLDVLKERGRIGTVATVAIVSRAPGLCRIGDDHAFWAIDFCKTSSNAGASGGPDGAFQLVSEWVVAEGVMLSFGAFENVNPAPIGWLTQHHRRLPDFLLISPPILEICHAF